MALGAEGSPKGGDRSLNGDQRFSRAVVLCAQADLDRYPQEVFAEVGLRLDVFTDPAVAGAACETTPPRVLILPVVLNGTSLAHIVTTCRERGVGAIIMSAKPDQIDQAAEAMNAGADDCLFAPFSRESLRRALTGALRQAAPSAVSTPAAPHGRAPHPPQRHVSADRVSRFHGMVGTGADMRELFRRVSAITAIRDPVMIHGEMGTGKSTLARVFHDVSERGSGPFLHLGCDHLDETARANAFWGKDGPLAQAHGGTLYLECLDATPLPLQRQLFAALKTRERDPLGTSDTRIVASLSRPAEELLAAGVLREDLYYALKVIELTLPPLRERPSDFEALLAIFLEKSAAPTGQPVPAIEGAAYDVLANHAWPGNLRELSNCLRGLLVTNQGPVITLAQLPVTLRHQEANMRLGASAQGVGALIGQPMAAIERAVIEATIAAEGGSIPRAARVLDLSPSTIYRKREAWEQEP